MTADRNSRYAVAVAALTIAAAMLRLPNLDGGYWFDEFITVFWAVRLPFTDVTTRYAGEYIQPFYGVLAKGSAALFGEHPWSVRLPALVFAVATVPVLYRLASAITSRFEALLATALLAVSYHHVWFSQNARGYTVLGFVAIASTWLLISLVERPRWSAALGYALCVGVGVYTHLTAAFMAAAHAAVWAVVIGRERDALRRSALLRAAALALGGAVAVSAVLYLPMAGEMRAYLSTPKYQRLTHLTTPGWAAVEFVRGLRVGFGAVGAAAVGLLAAAGGWSYLREKRMALALLVLPPIVTAAILFLVGASLRPRFLVAFLGFALILIVRGAAECGRVVARAAADTGAARAVATVLVGAMAVVSVLSLRYNYQHPKQDFEGALRYIDSNRAPEEPVLTGGATTLPFTRYYNRPWASLPDSPPSLREYRGRVWIAYAFPEYMNPDMQRFLTGRCNGRRTFPGTVGGGDVVVCTVLANGVD